MCRSKTKRSLVEVSRGYILMHTSDLRRRPSCLYGDRFFGEAHLWTYGLRLFGAKRSIALWFFLVLFGRNSTIIGLHSSVSFTAQLLVRELLNHVWFNNLPIYDPRSWSLFTTWTPIKNPEQLEAFGEPRQNFYLEEFFWIHKTLLDRPYLTQIYYNFWCKMIRHIVEA